MPKFLSTLLAIPARSLRAWRAKRGRVVPGRPRGVLHPPKRPPKAGVGSARPIAQGRAKRLAEHLRALFFLGASGLALLAQGLAGAIPINAFLAMCGLTGLALLSAMLGASSVGFAASVLHKRTGWQLLAIISKLDLSHSSMVDEFWRHGSDRAADFRQWLSRKNPYRELGAAGNLDKALRLSRRATGRQGHAARRPASRKPATKSSSADGDGGGDGEPPHRRLKPKKQSSCSSLLLGDANTGQSQNQPLQLYNTEAFANLVGSAKQTIYNLVSSGKLSRPIATLAGPRFTVQHYLEFTGQAPRFDPEPTPVKASPQHKRGRGRPRIAAQMGQRGVR